MPKLSPAAQKRANAKRKATIARKKRAKSRGTVARRRRTSTAVTRYRQKCPLNTYPKPDGGCTTALPCVDSLGRPVPFSTRGKYGICRLKKCGPGLILDPKTGRCVSSKTPDGQVLALAKKYDDAVRFVEAYRNNGGPINTYYQQFNADDFNNHRQNERRKQLATIERRALEAHAEKRRKQAAIEDNKSFVRRITDGLSRGAQNPQGGASFSFF
ncbi:unnamed protein product [Sphacelaria rigidula]